MCGFASSSSLSFGRIVAMDSSSAPSVIRVHLLEQFQPAAHQGLADLCSAAQILRRLSPVEPDPAGGVTPGRFDEPLHLCDTAVDWKHLLDDYGLARRPESL